MRRGLTWAATSVPEIRRQWCNALAATIERNTTYLEALPAEAARDNIEAFGRLRAKVADAISEVQAEADALRGAQLYWVSRDMVGLAVGAAATLPSWTPAEAVPTPTGLLCWARPAGLVPFGDPATATNHVEWDAVWWWTRPDGLLQLTPSSRFTKDPDLLASLQVRTPIWSAHSIWLDPLMARTEEVNGSEDMHRFISVVGAAWLLMSQPNITEKRVTEPVAVPPGKDSAAVTAPLRQPPSVTIIELRRNQTGPKDQISGKSRRQYRGRWMVGWPNGYWRQQRYGPGGSLRKPVLIAPHTAGPKDGALVPPKERVYAWRR
jgi:hypothetical protein